MTHERLLRIHTQDNRLWVSGKPLTDWLNGSVKPHYVYSKIEINTQLEQLQQALPRAIKLHYAIKANPMPALVQHVSQQVAGLDVASAGELALALKTGINPADISFAGPAKQYAELEAAVAAGVVINVESPTEMQRITTIAKAGNMAAKIALRVNPDFELKQSGMKMAGGAKAFGIDAEKIPLLLTTIDTDWLHLVGLHIFAGSQNLSVEAIIDTQRQTFNLAQQLTIAIEQAGLGAHFSHVNIGGGLGIPYFKGQESLALEPIGQALAQCLQAREGLLRRVDIIMELGRYIVGEAGYYICQITDIKQSRGQTFLMVNGGLHHHLSNSGNFGQVIRKNYPVLLADCVEAEVCELVEIAGPLCTPLDIVAAKISLPRAAIGDYIVVLQSGAYGYSASPLGFLGHEPPEQLLV